MMTTGTSRRWLLAAGALAVAAGLGGFPHVRAETRPANEAVDTEDPVPVVPVHHARPSLSDDGRYLVTAGLPTDGSERATTVWLHDRTTADAPVELTTVPDTIRTGSSTSPSISGDGCVATVVTELAYDLFRDDDTGSRWDVYRLVLPHCGGTPGRWELVSTVDDAEVGIRAMDAVDPDEPAAMSTTGTVVAFTHQARPGDDLRTTVSVVDLTVALGDPGRIVEVAGTPGDDPNTTFRYRGPREPSLSGDGRLVAFTSDAVADAAVPSWGDGPVGGGYATSRVYVWDRRPAEGVAAVRLVAGTAAGADTDQPAISGDGRFVAFRSAHAGLVPDVEYPACVDACPTQVYRADLADASIAPVVRLVSAQPPTVDGPTVAARRGGFLPAITDDGTQVAFVTRTDDLFSTAASAGADPNDGDLVVAEVDLGVIRRVSVQPDGVTPAPATHSHPVLSASGHVIAFDTLSANALVGSTLPGRQVVTLLRPALLALPHLDVGTVATGYPGPEWYVALLNQGPSTFMPREVVSSNPDFAITGGTCGLGLPVPPGGTCTVNVTLTPSLPGPITGTLTVSSALEGGGSVETQLSGAGGEPTLAPSPAGADLEPTVVGERSPAVAFDVANVGFADAVIAGVRVEGANPDDFEVTTNGCVGRPVTIGSLCAFEVEFAPTQAGYRTATVVVTTTAGQYTSVLVNGTGRLSPTISVAVDSIRAGDDIGVGIAGFPADSDVVLFWADGRGATTTVRTGSDGTLLTVFETRRNERVGERELVAQSGDVLAKVPVRVQRTAGGVSPASPTWGG